MTQENPYIWRKIKNGRMSLAHVHLDVIKNDLNQNEVIENYSGNGFKSQGYFESIPQRAMIPGKPEFEKD